MTTIWRLLAVWLLLIGHGALAGTFVNTIGSSEGIAISGYDTVAFFTQKKAIKGVPEYTHQWAGAKWLFSSKENLDLFVAEPEKYMPEYGGHCAYGVSEGYISSKPTIGSFEIYKGKLYLFPEGSKGGRDGVKNSWWSTGGGPAIRTREGDRNWVNLKARLESGEARQ